MDDFFNTDPAFFPPRALLFVVEVLDTIGVVVTTRCVLSRMRKLVQGIDCWTVYLCAIAAAFCPGWIATIENGRVRLGAVFASLIDDAEDEENQRNGEVNDKKKTEAKGLTEVGNQVDLEREDAERYQKKQIISER
ncbi:hypothetical protein F5882DRAFT_374082 [Hyaloscypha sp. PMI_1271]|nr:hypothetical protein F5882DRAFT_374082 [Hyaloscypha sp. PMI_1271]